MATQLYISRPRPHSTEQQQHQLELDAEKKRLERTTLAERLAEDYGINIAMLEGQMAEFVNRLVFAIHLIVAGLH